MIGINPKLRNLERRMYEISKPPETILNLLSSNEKYKKKKYEKRFKKVLKEMRKYKRDMVNFSERNLYNSDVITSIREIAEDYIDTVREDVRELLPYDPRVGEWLEKCLENLNKAYGNLPTYEPIGMSVREIKRVLDYSLTKFGKLNWKYKAVVTAAVTGILAYKGGYKFYMKYLAPLFDNLIRSSWEWLRQQFTPHIDIPPYEAKGAADKALKPVIDQLQKALENALNSASDYISHQAAAFGATLTHQILAIVWPLIAIGTGIGAISLYTKLDERKRKRAINNFIKLMEGFNGYLQEVYKKYKAMKSDSQPEPTRPTQEILKETPKEVSGIVPVVDKGRIKREIEEGIINVFREIRDPEEAKRRLEESFKEIREKYGINEEEFKKILSEVKREIGNQKGVKE